MLVIPEPIVTAVIVDRHHLTPLFNPRSIVIFAGDPGNPQSPTPEAQALRATFAGGPGVDGYAGTRIFKRHRTPQERA